MSNVSSYPKPHKALASTTQKVQQSTVPASNPFLWDSMKQLLCWATTKLRLSCASYSLRCANGSCPL